jgi:hypothetical protein
MKKLKIFIIWLFSILFIQETHFAIPGFFENTIEFAKENEIGEQVFLSQSSKRLIHPNYLFESVFSQQKTTTVNRKVYHAFQILNRIILYRTLLI